MPTMPPSLPPVPQANSEVSALLGRIPSAVGYQPTLATDLGQLQERITTTKKGSITSVQVRGSTVCVFSGGAGRWFAGCDGSQAAGVSRAGASAHSAAVLRLLLFRPAAPRACASHITSPASTTVLRPIVCGTAGHLRACR